MSEYRDKFVVAPTLWDDESVETARRINKRRKVRTARRRSEARVRAVRDGVTYQRRDRW